MMNKTLSIIIPVYNPNIEHFSRCIDSIYSQISDEIEVIIVDDASTDKSFLDVLSGKEYVLLTNEKNLKAGLSRQVGLDYSKADFVTFVDQDDELVEDTLQYMVKRLKESGCELIYRTQQYICKDYDFAETGMMLWDNSADFLHGAFFNRESLVKYDVRFSEELKGSEDTYFLSKISAIQHHNADNLWLNMEERLVTYRWYLWDDSTSHTPVNGHHYFIETFDTFIDCHIYTLQWAKDKWNDPTFYIPRVLMIIINIYLYNQYYAFSGEITDKMKSESRRFIRWVLDFINVSKAELIDLIKQNPIFYYQEFNETQKRYPPFIPEQSLKEWL